MEQMGVYIFLNHLIQLRRKVIMWIRFKNKFIESSVVISPKLLVTVIMGFEYSDSIKFLIKSFAL